MKQLYIVNADKFIGLSKFLSIIESELELDAISPAQLIHDIRNTGDPLGMEVWSVMNAGKQLNSELVERLIMPKIIEHDFPLLIGYPRTQAQLKSLKKVLLENNIQLKLFLYLKNSEAINFGHIEIQEKEMTLVDVTEPNGVNAFEFKIKLKALV